MASAASGESRKVPKSHAAASAATGRESPPDSPAAFAMMPESAAPIETAKA